MARFCSKPGCSMKHAAKGFCGSHYKAYLRGDVDSVAKKQKARQDDLWDFVKKELRLN